MSATYRLPAGSSTGYEGQIMPDRDWARHSALAAGRRYWCYNWDSLKVSAYNGTRQVRISAGLFGGQGIVDDLASDVIIDFPQVASGTRYFLVAARRVWESTGGYTELGIVSAGTSPNLASHTWPSTPGAEDAQPLAMVAFAAGRTMPSSIVDLRVMGTEGSLYANHDMVLQYLRFLGAQVRIGDDDWSFDLTEGGTSADWVRYPFPGRREVPVDPANNVTAMGAYASREGGTVQLRGRLLWQTANFEPRPNNEPYLIGRLPHRFRPSGNHDNRRWFVPGFGSPSSVPIHLIRIDTDGTIRLTPVGSGRSRDVYLDSISFPTAD